MSITRFEPITKEQAADILGVSIRTIENHVRDGQMPAPRTLGRRVYWHPDLFYAWLDALLRAEPTTDPADTLICASQENTGEFSAGAKSSGKQRNATKKSKGSFVNGQSSGANALHALAARDKLLLQELATT